MKKVILLIFFPIICYAHSNDTTRYLPYLKALANGSEDPVKFVKEKMAAHPLLIFDDGLHTAADPFKFYRQLIADTAVSNKLNYIFLEVVPSNNQKYIDSFLNAAKEDSTLLFPAFQNDYGTGFPYQTYFDLFHTIYQVNKSLPAGKKIKVYGVGFPVYWEGIHDRQDLAVFRNSLLDYDFHMYRLILSLMHDFRNNERAFFLTNTRHAYKNIKDKAGNLYWNCNTFFTRWHPGKTYSIRIHNATLFIESAKALPKGASVSASGTDAFNYHFDRMTGGIWDYAFQKFNQYPLAIDINNTPFGADPYEGNLALNVSAGSTMADAYDAVIVLKPLEEMQQTEMINYIYTPAFMGELARRYRLLYTPEEIARQMKDTHTTSIEELLLKTHPHVGQTVLPQVQQLSPIDAWESK